ncbi:MAG: hypothetical protein QOG64_1336, partial [Acidimicrobiaceae bacterium]|nr:hypothetical protein [Acidimicrobiaceae bacterium]
PGYKRDDARDKWNEMAAGVGARFDEQGLEALGRSPEVRAASRQSPAGLARAARGMLAQRDARVIRSLPDIKVPALVLVGAEDRGYLAGTDYMAARIPNTTKVVIPDAGHAANIDQPGAFNAAVVAFLESLTQPR